MRQGRESAIRWLREIAGRVEARRRFGIVLLACGVLGAGLAGGCGGGSETASGPSSSAASAVTRGGVLRVAELQPITIDPAVAASAADYFIVSQVYDRLIDAGSSMEMRPALAESWDTTDSKTWTFHLRKDVVFSDGTPFTSADVVYSLNRIRDPKTGSGLLTVFEQVKSIEAPDDYTVVVELKAVNAEFPVQAVTPPQAAILPRTLKDPKQETLGTGAFVVENYEPGVRTVLGANPKYWRTDSDGQKLPYLDGIDVTYSPDLASGVESLKSGGADLAGSLTYDLIQSVASDPGITLTKIPSNYHYALAMNCTVGATKDPRVRLALRLGTDTQKIIDVVRPGYALQGNGTPAGPLYPYYVDEQPPYDPAKAKQLLAEAGYANGLDITIQAMNAYDVPAMATVWKQQMKDIGVNVEIQVVPQDVYYGDGKDSWLDCQFGITDWGSRPTALMTFQLAYVTDAAWSSAKWSDPEFDAVCKRIQEATDETERYDLYREAQEILMDRQPAIIVYFETQVVATSSRVQNIENAFVLDPNWDRCPLCYVWLAE